MALQPVIYSLGALGTALYWYVALVAWGMKKRGCVGSSKGISCVLIGFAWTLFCTAIVLPIFLALAAAAAGLGIGLLTVPCIYYGFAYIIRVVFTIASA